MPLSAMSRSSSTVRSSSSSVSSRSASTAQTSIHSNTSSFTERHPRVSSLMDSTTLSQQTWNSLIGLCAGSSARIRLERKQLLKHFAGLPKGGATEQTPIISHRLQVSWDITEERPNIRNTDYPNKCARGYIQPTINRDPDGVEQHEYAGTMQSLQSNSCATASTQSNK